MIIVVPSCLKDADGARSRSDQNMQNSGLWLSDTVCTVPLGPIVATFVYASSQGQCTHSAWTKIPKIVATFVHASSQGQHTHSARTKIFGFYETKLFMYPLYPQHYDTLGRTRRVISKVVLGLRNFRYVF